jgi:hypothetical protein
VKQILIPVELCKFALAKRKTREVTLWLFLKSISSGHFLLTSDLTGMICNTLHYKTEKTFRKHFHWLIKKGWITVNGRTGSHRIISMDQLARKYQYISKSCSVFSTDDFSTIRGFFVGTVIKYLIRGKGQSAYRRHEARKYCPYPFITLTRLAKFLEVPRSTAVRFKNRALRDGYIQVKHKFDRLLLPPADYRFLKQMGGDETRNMVMIKNRICEQKPDLITSTILIRKKGKHPGKKWTQKEDIYIKGRKDEHETHSNSVEVESFGK